MMFQATFLLICLHALSLVSAYPIKQSSPEKLEARIAAPGDGDWFLPEDHPSTRLFRRQAPGDVGSPEWQAHYPEGTPSNSSIPMPKAWVDALRAAEAAGLIPKIPQSVEGKYDKTVQPKSVEVCSSTDQCRAPDDIWDVPEGIVALSFDDGPTPASVELLDYLKQNNQPVTHFMIGDNIRENATIFMTAFKNGNDIASHTYSHRYLTSLTNDEILAEIGWTSQIVYDLTGGRVMRYIRPPYGDSDNRVRAIIKHVFGMVQVNWNYDTDDFQLDTQGSGITQEGIQANLSQWIKGPKSPGLNILEHELSKETVKVFKDFYPSIKANGWVAKSIPGALGTSFYLNAADNTGDVVSWRVAAGAPTTTSSTTSETPTPTETMAVVTTPDPTPTALLKSSSLPSISYGLANFSFLITFSCIVAALFA